MLQPSIGCSIRRSWKGRAGFSFGEPVKFWSKTSGNERKTMIMEEVSLVELECYLIKAMSQGKQRAWTWWEDTIHRAITWRDIWKTPQAWPSFLVRAVYDTLPCPQNLSQWF